MYELDFDKDSDTVLKNKMFNNIQLLRTCVERMHIRHKLVDADTINAAQALAREIKTISDVGNVK